MTIDKNPPPGAMRDAFRRELWVAVILQAVLDLDDLDPQVRHEAEDFFSGKHDEIYTIAEYAELNGRALVAEYKAAGAKALVDRFYEFNRKIMLNAA